ncbi:MAG: hypothetical protein IAF38_06180, partial [Bacteroidia bacterium]|nr:hypothetical protein [Bacteroidia bacterium]
NEADDDEDGVDDEIDNCIGISNPDQSDEDCDSVGDACDVCPGGDDSIDNNNDGQMKELNSNLEELLKNLKTEPVPLLILPILEFCLFIRKNIVRQKNISFVLWLFLIVLDFQRT